MNFRRSILALFVLVLCAGSALAQTPVVDPGWNAFIIRENAIEGPPLIELNEEYGEVALEFVTFAGSQKAGLGTNQINGATVSQIATLHIDRLDDPINSGSLDGPYFNIWITDGLGNYAVVANEPSDAEWSGSRWDVADWEFLRTKQAKVYETPGWNSNTSWVHTHVGHADPLTFNDIASLIVQPPPVAYILDVANGVGGGAPDDLDTNIAYGYNWIFGDTMSNYVSGDEGFVVNNYYATTDFNVANTTQGTTYSTIEAALAAANAGDNITVADGTYNPPNTLNFNQSLTLIGESETGVIINIPAAGSYGMRVAASDVTLENFTLLCNAANINYPIHASGTSNPTTGFDNLSIRNATISGAHRRTGFDIHGFNHLVLSNLTSSDAWGGNGLQVTGCVDVDMDNITCLNNTWGSIAIYCSGPTYLNRGSDDVMIDGNTLVADGVIFSQDEFGLSNTNIVIPGWEYLVMNNHFREGVGSGFTDSEGYAFFAPDQATAMGLALGFSGYEQNSALRNITTGALEVYPGITLQAAVEHADLVDNINIGLGTILIPSQVRIDKNLTITGMGSASTTLAAAYAPTGGNYTDTISLIYVDTGVTAIIKNLGVDGTGFAVPYAIQSRGDNFTVQDCSVSNIVGSTYDGRGIVFLTGTGLVKDCTLSNIHRIGVHVRGGILPSAPVVAVDGLTYTGKGAGDWLDYGVEFGGGGQGTATNCVINNCQGIATVDGSTSASILVTDFYGNGTSAEITDSDLTGNTSAVVVGYDAPDMSQCIISGCDFSGSTDLGVSSTGVEVNALGNWWGAPSGPLHPTTNPSGMGVGVSDNVLYDPWLSGGLVTITSSPAGPVACGQPITLTFNLVTDEFAPVVFGYNALVRTTDEVSWGPITDLLPFTDDNNFFYTVDQGNGVWDINSTTVGNPTHPIVDAGTWPLFSVTFTANREGVAEITFDEFFLRDPNNQPIGVMAAGTTIVVDCTEPAPVTNITASPHHNKVEVTWDHTGQTGDSYWIYQGLWDNGTLTETAYPEYDDIPGNHIPARPVNDLPNPGEGWVRVDNDAVDFPAESFFDVMVVNPPDLHRGVYYYEVYAVDAAGNVSAPAAANDRATNYWLGDINFDGNVSAVSDMSALGAAFGESEGDLMYNAYCDVGRTDDWSRLGIPTTDNVINFEDLMIFSMNFGVVAPDAKAKASISSDAQLSWVSYGDNRYGLRLVESEGLKGVHLRANLPEGSSIDVTAGELLDQQSEMTFLKNIGTGLDVSLSVTGVNNGFRGQGDLIIVESSVELAIEDLVIDLRGSDNSSIAVQLDSESGVFTPRVFSLEANYPNPFNPMTKISFSLPEAQPVRLNIYGIDGALVTTLVNETRGSGLHEVLWNGCNDAGQVQASGMYFYRIEAGPYSQVRKMTLMK